MKGSMNRVRKGEGGREEKGILVHEQLYQSQYWHRKKILACTGSCEAEQSAVIPVTVSRDTDWSHSSSGSVYVYMHTHVYMHTYVYNIQNY